MKLSEKVAYLKGLADGLKLDSEKAEVKMINGIVDVLDEIASVMDLNSNDILEMTDRVDEIDMDLGDLEAFLFEGFDIEEFTEDDLDGLDEELDQFAVVYTTEDLGEEPVEEVVEEIILPAEEDEPADEEIFAAADEIVAAAEAEEAAAEEAVEETAEEVAEEVPEEPAEETVEEAVEEPKEEAEEEGEVYEIECPTCGNTMFIDESVLEAGGIECPNCHQELTFEIEYED